MIIRDLGVMDYQSVAQSMKEFTISRQADSEDEVWLVEHFPVFTQGANGQSEHILEPHDIPIVQSDRGGQVTYHAPGQLIAYTLIDLRRHKIGVKEMVSRLENTVIQLLADFSIQSHSRPDAPGVYIENKKIASLGLRVKRGACYHGISFNVDIDLTPFSYINPCGYAGMEMTNLSELGIRQTMEEVKQQFVRVFKEQMSSGK